jgi:hypothetical protein
MPITRSGRWYNDSDARVDGALASAEVAVGTATSTAFDVEDADTLLATISVAEVEEEGTPGTVTGSLEVSYDGTNYETAGSWPQKSNSAAATHTKGFNVRGARKARWKLVVATEAVTVAITDVKGIRGR